MTTLSQPALTTAPENPPASTGRQDLTRTTLAVMCLLLLIATTLWVLRPFLAAGIWATMVVVSTWPVLRSLQARLGNRRAPAVAVMTLGLLLLLMVPLGGDRHHLPERRQGVGWRSRWRTLACRSRRSGWAGCPSSARRPRPPGRRRLRPVRTASSRGWRPMPRSREMGARHVGSVGRLLVHFLLVVIFAAILYANGETAARGVRRFGRRLAAERGENSVVLAGQAIRAVALGVGVTAVVQTVLGGIGLAVAGVPVAGFLTAVMLMLCIAQLGPALSCSRRSAGCTGRARTPGGPCCWSGASS